MKSSALLGAPCRAAGRVALGPGQQSSAQQQHSPPAENKAACGLCFRPHAQGCKILCLKYILNYTEFMLR